MSTKIMMLWQVLACASALVACTKPNPDYQALDDGGGVRRDGLRSVDLRRSRDAPPPADLRPDKKKDPPRCGDGNCDPMETAKSCPQDCGEGCPPGAARCKNDETIERCDDKSSWKAQQCLDLCLQYQNDYTLGCQVGDQGQASCVCGTYADFGDLCDKEVECAPGLVCVAFGGALPGFCSKTCTSIGSACAGAPPNTDAVCAGGVSDDFCVFLCDAPNTHCPPELSCSPIDYFCEP
jgi:hypothetical protein